MKENIWLIVAIILAIPVSAGIVYLDEKTRYNNYTVLCVNGQASYLSDGELRRLPEKYKEKCNEEKERPFP